MGARLQVKENKKFCILLVPPLKNKKSNEKKYFAPYPELLLLGNTDDVFTTFMVNYCKDIVKVHHHNN